jgi:hypothetical protein
MRTALMYTFAAGEALPVVGEASAAVGEASALRDAA